jgi:hypothetical protein
MSIRIMYKSYSLVAIILKVGYLFSISQSSEQAPFTSEIVGLILAIRTHVKRVSQRSFESRGFCPAAPVSSDRASW